MSRILKQTACHRKPLKKIASCLQIIHDRGDHWIVASNIGHDNVQVYDSVYSMIEQDTIGNFKFVSATQSPVIEIAKMQKQGEQRSADCLSLL